MELRQGIISNGYFNIDFQAFFLNNLIKNSHKVGVSIGQFIPNSVAQVLYITIMEVSILVLTLYVKVLTEYALCHFLIHAMQSFHPQLSRAWVGELFRLKATFSTCIPSKAAVHVCCSLVVNHCDIITPTCL